jgi:hypothetical protein
MILKKQYLIILFFFIANQSFAQGDWQVEREVKSPYKFSISTPVITLSNIGEWNKRTSTQHIELHFKYNVDAKNIIGVKFATWRLFQPMGILWWDGLFDKIDSQTEFYPGYLQETGLGISYQRMVWKGLFTTVEMLPQIKTYLNENKVKVGNGFKLYTSFHVGYHFDLFKCKRFYIEPQIHCQAWIFDTNIPSGFKVHEDKWKNYFLFEPNLYFGVNF